MANGVARRPSGPAIRAVPLWLPGNLGAGRSHQLLTDEERAQLATIATIVRFKKGDEIYLFGEPVDAIFNVISGVVKTYQSASDGHEHIAAFLHQNDLFGLSEDGRYTNSAKAITPVTAYRLPVSALRRQLSKDANLDFQLITNLCHALRQAQRHALLLAQRHASARLAMFLQLQEQIQSDTAKSPEIYVPIDRSDVAAYVGMSLAAVSRAFRDLSARRIIGHRDRRHVKILDRKAFEKLAS